MSNFILSPLDRATDVNGAPIAGAKLYTYEAGSSTPKTAYSNEALTAAHANPVIADSAGWFGKVYGTKNELYRLVLTDASDNVLEEWDNVNTALLTSDSDVSALSISILNPITYGAVGDGASDEYAEVQAAIDAANTAGGGTVYLLGKTYRCDSQLTMYSNVKIVGPGTLDFTACPDNEYIVISGTEGDAVSLSSNATYRAITISASASGLEAGDILHIRSSESLAGSVLRGELVEVVNTSPSIIISTPLIDDYNVSSGSASFREITPIENVTLEDMSIISAAIPSGTNVAIVRATRARNLTIRNVRFTRSGRESVHLTQCLDTIIDGCYFGPGSGPAVSLRNATKNTHVSRCVIDQTGVGISALTTSADNGGVNGLKVYDCDFRRSTAALDIYEAAHDVIISKCRFAVAGGPLYFRPMSGSFSDNTFSDSSTVTLFITAGTPNRTGRHWTVECSRNTAMGGLAIESTLATFTGVGGALRTLRVCDNVAHLSNGLDILITWTAAVTATLEQLEISRNLLGSGVIDVNNSGATPVISKAIIRDNNFSNSPASYPIEVDFGTAGAGISLIEQNHIDGDGLASISGIRTVGGGVVRIADNYFSSLDDASFGVMVENTGANAEVIVEGNNFNNVLSDEGISINVTSAAPEAIIVSGNRIKTDTGTSIDIITGSGAKNVVVADNVVESNADASANHCFRLSGHAAHVAISGNVFNRLNDLDSNIHLSSTAVGSITNVSISGNTFHNGTYGIEFTNGDGKSWASGNRFEGITSGNEYLGAVGRRVHFSAGPETITPSGGTPVNGTVCSYTIPANFLQAGDIIRMRAFGLADTFGGIDTGHLDIRFDGVHLQAGTFVEGTPWFLDFEALVVSTGTTGSIRYGTNYSEDLASYTPDVFNGIKTVNTTTTVGINLAASQGTANVPLFAHSFSVEIIRKEV